MIIYEVNITLPRVDASRFSAWITGHIDKILKIPGFMKAEKFLCEVPENSSTVKWSIQYQLESRENLENYFRHQAPQMRQEGVQEFPQMVSERRILIPL